MDLRAWDASPENRQAATRLALRSAVGIYLVYLAWQLGAGARKGQGGVPAAAAFAAAAALLLGAGGYLFYAVRAYRRSTVRDAAEGKETKS